MALVKDRDILVGDHKIEFPFVGAFWRLGLSLAMVIVGLGMYWVLNATFSEPSMAVRALGSIGFLGLAGAGLAEFVVRRGIRLITGCARLDPIYFPAKECTYGCGRIRVGPFGETSPNAK